MTIPYVNQTIRDGSSGALALGSELHVKIGAARLATVARETLHVYADADTAAEELGSSPLASAVAYHISATGLPCGVVITEADAYVDGEIGAITEGADNTGPSITDNSSVPYDDAEVVLEITTGGALGTSRVRHSLDGGSTWSAPYATAASLTVIPGITLTMASGTYVVGDTYSFRAHGSFATSSAVTSAIDVALKSSTAFRCIHVIGAPFIDIVEGDTMQEAAAALVVAVQATLSASAAAERRYTYAFVEGPDDTDNDALEIELDDLSADRVALTAEYCEIFNPLSRRIERRPATWPTVARVMSVSISRDAGAVVDGPLVNVRSAEHDEYASPTYDALRVNALRTWVGRTGYYVTRGRMLAAIGSDFADIVKRQVMDVACAVSYDALLDYINVDLVVNESTGRIDEAEAQGIERFVVAKLRQALVDPGHVVDVSFTINRTTNLLTTETIRAKTAILPKGYARYIENELSFRNPAAEATEA